MTNHYTFPKNLASLHRHEQSMREKAMAIIQNDPKLLLHLNAIEHVMSLTNLVREYPENNEDFKVIKMLCIRTFNAFGSSLELMFTGYHQNGGMVMRDILETMFLLDMFGTDRTSIERWRFADRKIRMKEFSPLAVRKFLDERDKTQTKRRAEMYKMFSELAAHPNMHSQHMLREEKDGDIVTGPFMEASTLDAGLSELGRLAVQIGEILNTFFPKEWDPYSVRASFSLMRKEWRDTF